MRAEQLVEGVGLSYRLVVEQRVRYPDKPLLRVRIPVGEIDPDSLLVRLSPEREEMARRLLRDGARGWRRWSTLRRQAGRSFSPFAVEQVLDELVRLAGLHVEDRFRNGAWLPERFRVDESMWPWLEIVDPAQIQAELERDLTRPELLGALAQGRPPGMDWRSFDFCLRSAERLLDLREHGVRPSSRELAGLVSHTKAWTDLRKAYLERLLGEPFAELVAQADRQLSLRGPLRHPEGGLWASAVADVELELVGEPAGVVLVENLHTFEHLLGLAEHSFLVLWVPGGPPPAEVELVRRLAALAPEMPFHACFDLDPAGIRIARLLAEKSGVSLRATGMTPALYAEAERKLELNGWDVSQLSRQAGVEDELEPLREALLSGTGKVEQETIQRRLYGLFAAA